MWQSQEENQGHSDPRACNMMITVRYTQRKYTGGSKGTEIPSGSLCNLGVSETTFASTRWCHLHAHLTESFPQPRSECGSFPQFLMPTYDDSKGYPLGRDLSIFAWDLSHPDPPRAIGSTRRRVLSAHFPTSPSSSQGQTLAVWFLWGLST